MSRRELGRRSFAESTAAIAWPNWAAATHRIDPVAGSSNSGATPEQAAARVVDRADVASPQSIATPQGECFSRHTGSPENVTRAWTRAGTHPNSTTAAVGIAGAAGAGWRLLSRPQVAA